METHFIKPMARVFFDREMLKHRTVSEKVRNSVILGRCFQIVSWETGSLVVKMIVGGEEVGVGVDALVLWGRRIG